MIITIRITVSTFRRLRVLFFCICGTLLFATGAIGQQVEFSSTLNPVGSGARATGMGGAFIAVADDATAASWNPAGLVQLEKPEVSLVYSGFLRDQSYQSVSHPEIETSNSMDASGINYASAAYPFVLFSRNMIISLNYQRLYEMNKKVNMNYNWPFTAPDFLHDTIQFQQEGYLYALSPAMAVQVDPALYLGVTLNFWRDLLGPNGWENTYRSSGSGMFAGFPLTQQVYMKNTFSFDGFNLNAGFMWNISPKFILGGVYKSAFNAGLKEKSITTQNLAFGGMPAQAFSEFTVDDKSMNMPESYGLGLQYRHSDRFTLAMDVYRTQWSRFFIRDISGNETNPIDGTPLSDGSLRDTTQVHLGGEYLFIGNNSSVALRAGAFYDPEPAKGKVDDFYGLAFGAGYSTPHYALDAAYQYRIGRGVSGDIASIPASSVDITQQTVMVSGIVYF